jgi:predicted dinucleotide-utilizing enzyme
MKVKDKIKRFILKMILNDKDRLVMSVGALTLDELYKSRAFRRKVSGTIFEKRLKTILNDTE